MMSYLRLLLRYADCCLDCGAELPAHGIAWWSRRLGALCEACYGARLRAHVLHTQGVYEAAARKIEVNGE